MRSIADELALAQSPIDEEDLIVHILAQLGDEYNSITAALKVRENPVSYPELFDKLVDFERSLTTNEPSPTFLPPPMSRRGSKFDHPLDPLPTRNLAVHAISSLPPLNDLIDPTGISLLNLKIETINSATSAIFLVTTLVIAGSLTGF